METRQAASVDNLAVLLVDWARHLRARNLSPKTIASYSGTGRSSRMAGRSGDADERPALPHLQQFWRWPLDDGEIARSPMERRRPPEVPEQPVPLIVEGDSSRSFVQRVPAEPRRRSVRDACAASARSSTPARSIAA